MVNRRFGNGLPILVDDQHVGLDTRRHREAEAELQEIVDWLLEAARPLRDRELTPPSLVTCVDSPVTGLIVQTSVVLPA